jgi:pimeloyl-ACP methyl ester carboxylesterase
MMMTLRCVAAFVLASLCTAPAGTAALAQPAAPPSATRTLVDVPGAPEPHTPPEYNRGRAFRYALLGAPAPSTVLVLIPGLNSGPNTMDIISRSLLLQNGPGLEVWITVPRPTLLQDRRGVEAALAYRNPDFALGYYYGSLEIDGHRFHLLQGPEVPFMAYWGLDVHLRDIDAVVREIQARYPHVRIVLGGHSLGGILAAAYAGYDFAEGPGSSPTASPHTADVGAGRVAGLLFVDGLPLRVPFRLTPGQYLHGIRVPFFGRIPGVLSLTAPDPKTRGTPFTKTRKLARTQDSILVDVLSVYAFLRPQARSYFPFAPRRALRITNEALVAAIFSDEMQPDVLIRANVERPIGVFRTIEDHAHVTPHGLLELASGYPAAGESLIRLADAPNPPPRVSLRELLATILLPGGDFTEWYFPWRLVLDLGLSASLQPSDAFARQYMSLTGTGDTSLPMLIIGAGKGLVRSAKATEFYRSRVATPPDRITVKIFPDLSHLDVEDANPNPAVPLILTWLNSVVH